MATKGRLSEISLPTLIQLGCQETTQAQLSIRHKKAEATLFFDSNNIVHASLKGSKGDFPDNLEGEEVIYQVLKWDDGDFSLEPGVAPPLRTIQKSWSSILLNGLQRQDEERRGELDLSGIEEDKEIEEGYEMADNLTNILAEIGGEVTGFMGAAVVGMDGLTIAENKKAKLDTEALSAQMTVLVKLIDTTKAKLDAGSVEDYLLSTEKAYVLLRFLGDKNFYLGLSADRKTANVGNMRLVSRTFSERLTKALSH